jgi:hypothetical protein
MRKILALMVLLVLVAGCGRFGVQRKETIQLPEVKIGTQGVELSFSPTNPREVFENQAFTYLVTASNLGTTDVDSGAYAVSHEQQYLFLSGQPATGRFNVRGKSVFNPQGEERHLHFVFTAKPLGPQVQRYPATITISACYPTQTTAPATVCIDTDIFNKQRNKICRPQTINMGQGQGAPVAVAVVETRMTPHQDLNRVIPEFVLTLQNKGSGEVVEANNYLDACSGMPLGDAWNVVSVQAQLSDTYLTCTPTPVKLKRAGETKVVCSLPEGIPLSAGTYVSPLAITLDYGYLTSITSQVTIIKPTA